MKKIYLLPVLFITGYYSSAQVAVSKEPMHHNVFENAFVRVLDVHILPGDTSLFHKHETPSVFIVLNAVKTGSEVIKEAAAATALQKDASITFEGFYTSPRIHRVWNEDTAVFHVMDVEVLSKGQHFVYDTLLPPFKLLFDEKPVRSYRLNVTDTTLIYENKMPQLFIGLTDNRQFISVNNISFRKKGDVLFVHAGTTVRIENKNKEGFSFAVLEFK